MSSSVEKIKEKLSIADVISSYIKIDKAGANYKAKCPFHNEKTPSFFISPDRGTYYCFGCGAKGDMFTFVEEFEGVEFRQALVNLASKAGIELVPEKAGERDEKARLFRAVELAVEFFEKNLAENEEVKSYLAKRGLTEVSIKTWQVGYAPNDWRLLYDNLKSQKVSDEDMLATGLIKRNDKDGPSKFYDVFRGRIMFPIFDISGRPVAFSGRIFVDDEKAPKYLNSPATVLFNKSETIYGLDRAKSSIRKQNYSIMVEGQMDLVLSHQAGLTNTVASSGTAMTAEHLRRLLRLSPRIMFAFDSDSAGFAATKRSAELALEIGMEVKVAPMPAGEDPASLVTKNPNLWRRAVKNSKHIIDFYTDTILARGLADRLLSREIRSGVLPSLLSVESKTEQASFIKNISERTGLKEEALWDDLKTLAKARGGAQASAASGRGSAASSVSQTSSTIPISRKKGIERRILGVIYWLESKSDPEKIATGVRKKFKDLVGASEVKQAEEVVVSDKDKLIFEAEQYYENSKKFGDDIDELLINLEEERLKEDLAKSMAELHKAEVDKHSDRTKKFLEECQSITNKLATLRKKQI